MNQKVDNATGGWVDPDDAPELTQEWFDRAHVYKDGKLVKRGEGEPPFEELPKLGDVVAEIAFNIQRSHPLGLVSNNLEFASRNVADALIARQDWPSEGGELETRYQRMMDAREVPISELDQRGCTYKKEHINELWNIIESYRALRSAPQPSVTSEELTWCMARAKERWIAGNADECKGLTLRQYQAQAILTAFHVSRKE